MRYNRSARQAGSMQPGLMRQTEPQTVWLARVTLGASTQDNLLTPAAHPHIVAKKKKTLPPHWFFINGRWEQHNGSVYSYKDSLGKTKMATSQYTVLLVVKEVGVNKQGAKIFELKLYDHDQLKLTGEAFSGGNKHLAVKDGNYTINTTIRDSKGPTQIDPNSPLGNPPVFYGIQVIKKDYLPGPVTPNGNLYDVYGAYGPKRARLNPWQGKDEGDYYHGQYNGHGWTHGCLCYGEDPQIIEYLWNLPPQKVAVAVNVRVNVPAVKSP
jgi:hypothetical protein